MDLLHIQNKIHEIRGHKVMLDFDLAALYEVETRVLNQAVKRNIKRFPGDFMFQLNKNEWEILMSQFVISKTGKRGGTQKLPYAFTEQGLAMLSGILNTDKAIDVNKKTNCKLSRDKGNGLVMIWGKEKTHPMKNNSCN